MIRRFFAMAIPDLEVKYIYHNTITKWFRDEVKSRDLSPVYRAMLEGDAEAFQVELSRLLQESISYMDTKEAFYHGFMVGVLSNLNSNRFSRE